MKKDVGIYVYQQVICGIKFGEYTCKFVYSICIIYLSL